MWTKSVAIVVVACVQLVGIAATADAAEVSSLPIPNVTLLSPSAAELVAANPDWDGRNTMGGAVILTCTIRADDGADCKPVEATSGFAEEGVQIGKMLRVKSNDQAPHAGEVFNIWIDFPVYESGAPTAPVPVLKIKAEGRFLPPPVPFLAADRHSEPWVVTFVTPSKARVRTCDDNDPVVSSVEGKQGKTLTLANNQRLELYVGTPPSWVVVQKVERCPVTDGRAK